jgi:hypothetical protein
MPTTTAGPLLRKTVERLRSLAGEFAPGSAFQSESAFSALAGLELPGLSGLEAGLTVIYEDGLVNHDPRVVVRNEVVKLAAVADAMSGGGREDIAARLSASASVIRNSLPAPPQTRGDT